MIEYHERDCTDDGGTAIHLPCEQDGHPVVEQVAHDTTANTTGYAGTAIDDTSVVNQEHLLSRLTGVMGASNAAVLILDRNGSPVYTNPSARQMFGVPSARERANAELVAEALEEKA